MTLRRQSSHGHTLSKPSIQRLKCTIHSRLMDSWINFACWHCWNEPLAYVLLQLNLLYCIESNKCNHSEFLSKTLQFSPNFQFVSFEGMGVSFLSSWAPQGRYRIFRDCKWVGRPAQVGKLRVANDEIRRVGEGLNRSARVRLGLNSRVLKVGRKGCI